MIFLTSAVLVQGEIINSAIVGTLAAASKSRHRISIESRAAWIERAAEIEEGDYGAGDDDDHGEEEDYGDDDDNCDDDDHLGRPKKNFFSPLVNEKLMYLG